MRVTAECIPCYLNQCLNALEKGGIPDQDREGILVELLGVIAKLNRKKTPAENSTVVLHRLVELTGGRDLFLEAKAESNRQALSHLEKLRVRAESSLEPVREALKFSVAGNVVDMGLFETYDLDKAVDDVVKKGFRKDHYYQFADLLKGAGKTMIIGDNSGEIVFDRLLAEALVEAGQKVVYGVKGSFILNDATIEDARQAGMDEVCRVVSSGCGYLGTIEEKCSREFMAEIHSSDIVISKGQANYESMEGTSLAGDKTFFLLKAKCPVVARNLGVDFGDVVFVRNKPKSGK